MDREHRVIVQKRTPYFSVTDFISGHILPQKCRVDVLQHLEEVHHMCDMQYSNLVDTESGSVTTFRLCVLENILFDLGASIYHPGMTIGTGHGICTLTIFVYKNTSVDTWVLLDPIQNEIGVFGVLDDTISKVLAQWMPGARQTVIELGHYQSGTCSRFGDGVERDHVCSK